MAGGLGLAARHGLAGCELKAGKTCCRTGDLAGR